MIRRLSNGKVRVDYFDWITRRGWCCGTAGAGYPEAEALAWVVGQVRPGDVVEQDGRLFYVPNFSALGLM